ncbi:MAG: hypothetical protein QXG03_03855 [Halalkalicoccus sp.]
MTKRAAVIEIERQGGTYRVELRDRETGETIARRAVGGSGGPRTPYKHVCKLRVPVEETDIGIETVSGEIVLRADGRTWYRHELPTPAVAAAN